MIYTFRLSTSRKRHFKSLAYVENKQMLPLICSCSSTPSILSIQAGA